MTFSVRAIVRDVVRGRRDMIDTVVNALKDESRVNILRKHGLGPLLHYHYDLPSIPQEEIEQNRYLHAFAHDFVAEHADWSGIVVKGCSTARLYDNPLSRKMSDLDILMTKSNAIEFFKLLQELGYAVVEETENIKVKGEFRKIADVGARAALIQKLIYSHEMPPLRKDRDIFVDLNFCVAYRGTSEYRKIFSIDSIESYFAHEMSSIRGLQIGFPRASVDLLYLVVHYAAEMFLFQFDGLRPGVPDLRFQKLLDIAMYFSRKVVDVEDFVATVEAASADLICGYFFDSISDLFEIAEIAAIASRFKTQSEPYHNSYLTKEGRLARWTVPPFVRVEGVMSA